MASDTKNVKLGVCKVIFDGVDLGYTQGGVDVTVKTDTHKVMVDQFGKSPINEYIIGREVNAKVPLAEATLENLVATMPGATLSSTGGSKATGSITIATNPVDGDTILVNGTTVTFKTTVVSPNVQSAIGASAAASATALSAMLNVSTDQAIAKSDYSVSGAVVTVTYTKKLAEGNAFTLASGTAGAKVAVSGATLTGGADSAAASVSVTNGVGSNLLDFAKELRLHPINRADADVTEDFVIPRAATAGALQFAYKLESERIFNADFMGYPDPVTGKLFTVGA